MYFDNFFLPPVMKSKVRRRRIIILKTTHFILTPHFLAISQQIFWLAARLKYVSSVKMVIVKLLSVYVSPKL